MDGFFFSVYELTVDWLGDRDGCVLRSNGRILLDLFLRVLNYFIAQSLKQVRYKLGQKDEKATHGDPAEENKQI